MSKRRKKAEPTSWVVTLTVTRKVQVVCDECTREQAENDPWLYADDNEVVLDQPDWEVEEIEPNV